MRGGCYDLFVTSNFVCKMTSSCKLVPKDSISRISVSYGTHSMLWFFIILQTLCFPNEDFGRQKRRWARTAVGRCRRRGRAAAALQVLQHPVPRGWSVVVEGRAKTDNCDCDVYFYPPPMGLGGCAPPSFAHSRLPRWRRTGFGLLLAEKCFENTLQTVGSTVQNLRLGSINYNR